MDEALPFDVRDVAGLRWSDGKLNDSARMFALSLKALEWRDLGPSPGKQNA